MDSATSANCSSGTGKFKWGRSLGGVAGITIVTLKAFLLHPGDAPESALVTLVLHEQPHVEVEVGGEHLQGKQSDRAAVSSAETSVESSFGLPIESLSSVSSGFVFPMES